MVTRIALGVALTIVLATVAHADIPPLHPPVAWTIELDTDDAEHVWIAYPVDHSHGAPIDTYERVMPGAAFDPGRAAVHLYAFTPARLGTVTPPAESGLPAGLGIVGAPCGLDQWLSYDALHTFFEHVDAPSTPLVLAPDDGAMFEAGVVGVADLVAPRVADGALTLRLESSVFTYADAHTQQVVARADGRRGLPSTRVTPPSPAAAGHCGCHAGARTSPSALWLLLAWTLVRRQRHDKTCSIASVAPTTMR